MGYLLGINSPDSPVSRKPLRARSRPLTGLVCALSQAHVLLMASITHTRLSAMDAFINETAKDGASAESIHASVCMLVTSQAKDSAAWATYARWFLSEAVVQSAASALETGAAATPVDAVVRSEGPSQPSKKRKQSEDASALMSAAAVVVCDHCGGVVPEITLRVASLDGVSLDVTVPQRGLVSDAKRVVGQVRVCLVAGGTKLMPFRITSVCCVLRGGLQLRDMDPNELVMDLFVDGTEDALLDAALLDHLGLGNGDVLFMLQRAGV